MDFSRKQRIFCQRCTGFMESDTPLDHLQDMLRMNLKTTYILKGLSAVVGGVR